MNLKKFIDENHDDFYQNLSIVFDMQPEAALRNSSFKYELKNLIDNISSDEAEKQIFELVKECNKEFKIGYRFKYIEFYCCLLLVLSELKDKQGVYQKFLDSCVKINGSEAHHIGKFAKKLARENIKDINKIKWHKRTTRYKIPESDYTVSVIVTEHNNGRLEHIWYTAVNQITNDGWAHIKGSAFGHGYGLPGKMSALSRAEKLINEQWREFVSKDKGGYNE